MAGVAFHALIDLYRSMDFSSNEISVSAKEGAKVLDNLKKNAGDIDIMAGAGMNAQNIKFMLNTTSITSFHMSGKKVLESKMEYRNPKVSMGLPSLSEYEIIQTDVHEVRAAKLIMNMINPPIVLIPKKQS